MPRSFAMLLVGAAVALAATTHAHAEAVLNDWCLNIDGATASACNSGGTPSLPPGVNGSLFDFTLAPGANTLGSIGITLGPGAGQSVLAFMDYDLNAAAGGSFQDVGSVHGTLPTGVSFELDDPQLSSIYTDFSSGSLTNRNNVGTGGVAPNLCCDVAWALGLSGITVAAGTQEVVTFTVSRTAPTSGFYLQQTNALNGETIFFSESISPVAAVPEPATTFILGLGIAAIVCRRLRHGSRLTMT